MTGPRWSATIGLTSRRPGLVRWLERALAPEASREVPRARTTIRRRGERLELVVHAADAGAMRAALNTYLGWIALSVATVSAAATPPAAAPARRRGEALISRPP